VFTLRQQVVTSTNHVCPNQKAENLLRYLFSHRRSRRPTVIHGKLNMPPKRKAAKASIDSDTATVTRKQLVNLKTSSRVAHTYVTGQIINLEKSLFNTKKSVASKETVKNQNRVGGKFGSSRDGKRVTALVPFTFTCDCGKVYKIDTEEQFAALVGVNRYVAKNRK
jgi:hypothetical protein